MQIILDLGSGNTCRNDPDIGCRMIDVIAAVDNHKHEIIMKAQLFENAPPNIPLEHGVFIEMYDYAKEKGYQMTSSVFDVASLEFLLDFEVPFIKIANRRDLDWLIGEVPRKVPVYVSVPPKDYWADQSILPLLCTKMLCVSDYPAQLSSYRIRDRFPYAVSDHTFGLNLISRHEPQIWEKHFVLEHDDKNPDGGLWAMDPEELKEALELL